MGDHPAATACAAGLRRRVRGAAAWAVLGGAVAGCETGALPGGAAATQPPGTAPGYRISLPARATAVRETDQLLFEPAWLSIPTGGSVVWTNASTVVHDVTFDDPAITSPTMNPGNRYAVRFTRSGTYAYRCTFHVPVMVGTIVVGG
jgi:plastocyanin